MDPVPHRPSQTRSVLPLEHRPAQEILENVEMLHEECTRHQGSYLTLHRLKVRNHYISGRSSKPYLCDAVERPVNSAAH